MGVRFDIYPDKRRLAIFDCNIFDRKVIGWSFSSGMSEQETIIPTWLMACLNRPIEDNLIFHSDRGVEYACKRLETYLKAP